MMSEQDCLWWVASADFLKSGGTVFVAILTLVAASMAWLFKSLISSLVTLHGRLVERVELLIAIHAEMTINVENEASWTAGAKSSILARMEAYSFHPYDFFPYAPVYERNPIYDNLRLDITVLPTGVIEPVVRYYNESDGVTVQIQDLRSAAFATLGKSRRLQAVAGIYDDCAACVETGLRSLQMVAAAKETEWKKIIALRFWSAALALLGAALVATNAYSYASNVISKVGSASSCFSPKSLGQHIGSGSDLATIFSRDSYHAALGD